jgi:hypothetical protein
LQAAGEAIQSSAQRAPSAGLLRLRLAMTVRSTRLCLVEVL